MTDRALQADTRPLREAMVAQQVAARGVRDPRVLDAMREVPREAFLPPQLREFAYEDSPLPIDESQTISQPYIVASMTEALGLRGGERVLEIGTGSGYAAAVLARIAAQVFTVERHRSLAERARAVLDDLGVRNVRVLHGDGTRGWPEFAPYDAIVAAAGGPSVPRSLRDQLALGGRLVMPIGPADEQRLVRVTRTGEDSYREEELGAVRFVPLIGVPAFLLPLRAGQGAAAARHGLMEPRLERAIGVIYRPETELQSHYFRAQLPRQFDEYAWFDVTAAVTPLGALELAGVPDTYPFGL